MMSESSADNGDASTFEIVDKNAAADLVPPSALPDFASLGLTGGQQAKGVTAAIPPPSQFPSVPVPDIISSQQQQKPSENLNLSTPTKAPTGPSVNPYSIRATPPSASPPQPAIPPQAPAPVAFQTPPPAPVQLQQTSSGISLDTISTGHSHSSQPSIASTQQPVPGGPPPPTYAVGLDMGGGGGGGETGGIPFGEEVSSGDGSGGGGVWGWIHGTVAGSSFLTKVAETAKTSVDTVITTLDPQMKDFIVSSGAIELAVASDKEVKINGIKEGFQRVFAQVIARGLGSPGTPSIAIQPLGFQNGRKAAEGGVHNLRNSGLVPKNIPIVTVESFVFEAAPNRLFSADTVLLDDPGRNISLEVISQAVQIPDKAAELLKNHTPTDYALKDSGFAVEVGFAVAEACGSTPYDWQESLCGMARKKTIENAAAALAFQYKNILSAQVTQQ